MPAPLLCPKCSSAYDVSSYAPGHRFDCSCGQEIVVPDGATAPEKATSRLAVASLVLACLFCVPFAPLLGVVLGIVALVKIGRGPQLVGSGFAIGGIVVGGVSFVFGTGILAAIAIPNFIMFQTRSKTVEARTNVEAIRGLEEAYRGEFGHYLAAGLAPETIPGREQVAFGGNESWRTLGFDPGMVRYQYQVVVDADGGATVYARGDLDGDGLTSEFAVYLQDGSAGELMLTDELE